MTSINSNKPEILSKLGVGSGLDTTALVDSLVQAETAGTRESLDIAEEKYNTQISAFSEIKANLQVFKDNLELIQNNSNLGYQGSSSDTTVATFTANGNSASQSINSSLTVSSLATAHTLTGPTYSSTSATVGANTIAISFGTWSADPTRGGGQSFTSNGQSTITVTPNSSTTLSQLRDMINNAATDSDSDGTKDVVASIIYDGTNYMLALKSEFGASNEMRVVDTAKSYAYGTEEGALLTQRVAGTDASFTVDGISMTRSSNSVTDLFAGMTLNLLKTSSSAISIKSEVSLSDVETALTDYVTTYNDLYLSLQNLSKANNVDPDSGSLAGDTLLRAIMSELREANGSGIAGYDGGPYYLSNLGIKTNRDGTLSFANKDALKRNFEYNAESVRAFFKDQIYSDNAAITPLNYDFNNTVPGEYAVVVSGGNATVGGVATSVSGSQYTVGSGDAKGMVLNISSSNTTGTIYLGKSHLTSLEQNLNAFIKFNGLIDQKLEGNRQRLSDISEKRIDLEERVESITQRYRLQYAFMESAIASINETSNMLSNVFKSGDD